MFSTTQYRYLQQSPHCVTSPLEEAFKFNDRLYQKFPKLESWIVNTFRSDLGYSILARNLLVSIYGRIEKQIHWTRSVNELQDVYLSLYGTSTWQSKEERETHATSVLTELLGQALARIFCQEMIKTVNAVSIHQRPPKPTDVSLVWLATTLMVLKDDELRQSRLFLPFEWKFYQKTGLISLEWFLELLEDRKSRYVQRNYTLCHILQMSSMSHLFTPSQVGDMVRKAFTGVESYMVSLAHKRLYSDYGITFKKQKVE